MNIVCTCTHPSVLLVITSTSHCRLLEMYAEIHEMSCPHRATNASKGVKISLSLLVRLFVYVVWSWATSVGISCKLNLPATSGCTSSTQHATHDFVLPIPYVHIRLLSDFPKDAHQTPFCAGSVTFNFRYQARVKEKERLRSNGCARNIFFHPASQSYIVVEMCRPVFTKFCLVEVCLFHSDSQTNGQIWRG